MAEKSVCAGRANQHARHTRYPDEERFGWQPKVRAGLAYHAGSLRSAELPQRETRCHFILLKILGFPACLRTILRQGVG